jgi:hypothetical protein
VRVCTARLGPRVRADETSRSCPWNSFVGGLADFSSEIRDAKLVALPFTVETCYWALPQKQNVVDVGAPAVLRRRKNNCNCQLGVVGLCKNYILWRHFLVTNNMFS